MSFEIEYVGDDCAIVLTHTGSVDLAEVRASRDRLIELAQGRKVRGVVIDVRNAEINVDPVMLIDPVTVLSHDLPQGSKLGFVARENDQAAISVIVTSVATSTGTPTEPFLNREDAVQWVGLKCCD